MAMISHLSVRPSRKELYFKTYNSSSSYMVHVKEEEKIVKTTRTHTHE